MWKHQQALSLVIDQRQQQCQFSSLCTRKITTLVLSLALKRYGKISTCRSLAFMQDKVPDCKISNFAKDRYSSTEYSARCDCYVSIHSRSSTLHFAPTQSFGRQRRARPSSYFYNVPTSTFQTENTSWSLYQRYQSVRWIRSSAGGRV